MKHLLILLLSSLFLFFNVNKLDAQKLDRDAFTVQATQAKFLGKTKPIRDLAPSFNTSEEKKEQFENSFKEIPNFIGRSWPPAPGPDALPKGADPVWQSGIEKNLSTVSEPLVNINGIFSINYSPMPQDPAGDIGQDHYVQMVNSTRWQVFDKTGTPVSGVMAANIIWTGLGVQSLGDPIILYDQEVRRWLFTEFSTTGTLLLAISDTSDPMGTWNAYTFDTPGFPDYPKYSVWTNAYVLTTNESSTQNPIYFFDRQAMLNGDPMVDMQRITVAGTPGGFGFQALTPVDWSGAAAPPMGALPMIVRKNDDAWGVPNDRVEVYEFDVDFSNVNNTVVSSTNIITAPFDTNPCAIPPDGDFECVPQPNGTGIDAIPEVIMNQVHYRNFGTHEAMVMNFITDVTGTNLSGIRWIELRRTTGNGWSLYQEGTFAPQDGLHRFMGAIAMDGNGNIGLAYSVVGPSDFAGLRYTGRRASDPLGMMTFDEYNLVDGLSNIPNVRFGDYAAMSVDPEDDATFWFTSEYARQSSRSTRIAAFRLKRDTIDIGPFAMIAPVDASQSAAETVVMEVRNFGVDTITAFDVGYIFENGPAVVESVNYTLYPDSIYTHTFGQTVSMPALDLYNFKLFTSLAEDQNIPNDTLRKIIENLPVWDAGATNVNGLDHLVCSASAEVELEITNYGTDTLTSLNITYLVNFMNPQIINWTGSVPFGETETITVLLENLQNGTNVVAVTTAVPNGEVDQVVANNSYLQSFQVDVNGVPVSLNLLTDNWPQETTWQLADTSGNVLFSGGPYGGQAQTQIIEPMCLDPDGCFVFTIFDSYGDGIQFGGVEGNYTIQNQEGDILASLIEVDFGNEEVNPFCVNMQCAITAEVDVTQVSSTGAADGAILITATSGVSPFVYSIDNGVSQQDNGLFDGLAEGSYQVLMTDANGCFYTEEVVLDVATSIVNLEGGQSIRVYPNPTEGIFRIDVEGLQHDDLYLKFQIYDVTGRLVQHAHLPRYDNRFTGEVGLFSFPAGVYLIRFLHEDINRLVRVVKK